MIFFFDYLYLISCDYYKSFKSERDLQTWRSGGLTIVSGSTALVSGLINLLVFEFFIKQRAQDNEELIDGSFFYLKAIFIGVFVVGLILFGIRYKKYITYEQIVAKVRGLNNMQKVILNILVSVYLFTTLPLFIFVAWYFSP